MSTKLDFTHKFLLGAAVLSALACKLFFPSTDESPTLAPEPATEQMSPLDQAVCDAYQVLVLAWPADSAAVQAAGSADDVYQAVEAAGAALSAAGRSADDAELGRLAVDVGDAAVLAIVELSDDLREIGWIDFFDSERIGGDVLGRLCLEKGTIIFYP